MSDLAQLAERRSDATIGDRELFAVASGLADDRKVEGRTHQSLLSTIVQVALELSALCIRSLDDLTA